MEHGAVTQTRNMTLSGREEIDERKTREWKWWKLQVEDYLFRSWLTHSLSDYLTIYLLLVKYGDGGGGDDKNNSNNNKMNNNNNSNNNNKKYLEHQQYTTIQVKKMEMV